MKVTADAGETDAASSDGGDRITGTHHQFVWDSFSVPETASEVSNYAVNVDGDPEGRVENAFGSAIAALASSGAIDVQGNLLNAIHRGEVINLVNLRATSLGSASNVGVWIFRGQNPNPEACTNPADLGTCSRHLGGDATFDPVAPLDDPSVIRSGLFDRFFSGGPGGATLQMKLSSEGEAFTLPLVAVTVEFTVIDNDLVGASLGGAILEEDVESSVIPGMHDGIADTIARDCGGVAPDCCSAESEGESLVELFDTDDDCAVTLVEFRESSLLASLLTPDVDLFNVSGELDPRTDGVEDSVSVGFNFSAVGAIVELPEGFGDGM